MGNILPFNPTPYSQGLNARETCICFWTSHHLSRRRKSAAKANTERGKNGIIHAMNNRAKTALALALAIVGGIAAGLRCDASEWLDNLPQYTPRVAAYIVKAYTEGSDPFIPIPCAPSTYQRSGPPPRPARAEGGRLALAPRRRLWQSTVPAPPNPTDDEELLGILIRVGCNVMNVAVIGTENSPGPAYVSIRKRMDGKV